MKNEVFHDENEGRRAFRAMIEGQLYGPGIWRRLLNSVAAGTIDLVRVAGSHGRFVAACHKYMDDRLSVESVPEKRGEFHYSLMQAGLLHDVVAASMHEVRPEAFRR